jgi:hypothetical protein
MPCRYVWGSRGIAPHVINLSIGRKWVTDKSECCKLAKYQDMKQSTNVYNAAVSEWITTATLCYKSIFRNVINVYSLNPNLINIEVIIYNLQILFWCVCSSWSFDIWVVYVKYEVTSRYLRYMYTIQLQMMFLVTIIFVILLTETDESIWMLQKYTQTYRCA